MVHITPICGDDWGMVYDCFDRILGFQPSQVVIS